VQDLQCGFTEPQMFLAREGSTADELLDQARDILLPLSQRRHENGDDVDPVIEIFAKLPASNHLLQVAISGSQDPDINMDIAHSTDTAKCSSFEHAQQLGLKTRGEVANLVQEKGPPVSHFEQAVFKCDCACESAALVAKKLRLKQFLMK